MSAVRCNAAHHAPLRQTGSRPDREAATRLRRAAARIDDDVDTLVALGWAHRALGHTAEAEAAFARARSLEPRYPNLPQPGTY